MKQKRENKKNTKTKMEMSNERSLIVSFFFSFEKFFFSFDDCFLDGIFKFTALEIVWLATQSLRNVTSKFISILLFLFIVHRYDVIWNGCRRHHYHWYFHCSRCC